MRGFRPKQEISVQINHCVRPTGAINADRNAGVRSFAQIAIHPQRDLHILFLRQENLTHRNRLQRFFRDLSQNCRGVEPDLGALRNSKTCCGGRSIVPKHVVHRRLQIGVAESFDDDSIDVRDLTIDRLRSVDTNDRPDADRRIDRCPEMEFVRSVRLFLRRDHATERTSYFIHEIALRNSSQSLTPYDILSHRPSGRANGLVSASTQREISSARAVGLSHFDISTRTNPHKGSWPSASRCRRYQLITELRSRGETLNTDERSLTPRFNTVLRASSSTYNVR